MRGSGLDSEWQVEVGGPSPRWRSHLILMWASLGPGGQGEIPGAPNRQLDSKGRGPGRGRDPGPQGILARGAAAATGCDVTCQRKQPRARGWPAQLA